MLITVKCPLCETPVDAESTSFGSSQPCPKCEEAVDIPEAFVGEGVTIAGFEIRGKVGKGGMGVVYLANQISMQRPVAVKVLPPKMTSNTEAVERFLKEARMSARLEHSNIVTIIDAGEDTGFYYLAMRYVEGETLEDRLRRHRPLPEKQALRYMGKVIAALDFAWRHHKILHRDIKPSNIMVDEYDEIKLLDMGLAKDLLEDSALTVAGTILGTPYYMSPEQAKSSNELDFHTDMYSAGATLFHLLTGRTPFDGDGAINIMTKHITEIPPDVRSINAGVSEATANLVARLLEKEKDDRFETYQEVLDIINGILDDENVIVPLTNPNIRGLTGPLSKPLASKRSRTLFLAAALLTCTLITGAIIIKIAQNSMRKIPPVTVGPTQPEPPDPVASGKTDEELRQEQLEKERALARKQLTIENEIRAELAKVKSLAAKGAPSLKQAMRECRKLKTTYASHAMVSQIEQTLGDLEKQYGTLRNSVFKDIKREVDSRRKGGKFQDAIRYLEVYSGALPKETAKYREQMVRNLKDEWKKKRETDRLAREHDEALQELNARKLRKRYFTALNDVSERVALALTKQDFDAALQHYNEFLENAQYNAFNDDITRSFKGLDTVCRMNDLILESYRKDIDKTISVRLRTKKVDLRIMGIEETTIKANREVNEGWMANNFEVLDLTPQERYNRIKGEEIAGDVKDIIKAILYLELKEKSKAIATLNKSDAPIAHVLLSVLGESAELAVKRLLKLAELPEDQDNVGMLQTQFINRKYSTLEASRIQAEANKFLVRFNRDEAATTYMPLAKLMADVGQTYHFPKGLSPAKLNPVLPHLYGAGATASIGLQSRFSVVNELAVEAENSIGMRFRLVPAGAAYNYLGNPPAAAYYLGKYEVTAKQWKAVMGDCPFFRKDNLPVENVTISQTVDFLDKLCDREGIPRGSYRLPSSTEWVYACSAGIRNQYYFGDDAGKLKDYANFLDKTAPAQYGTFDLERIKDSEVSDGHSMTAVVGSYPCNPWGFYDMLGNVAEFVADGDIKFAKVRGAFKGGAWIFPAQYCNPAREESLSENLVRIPTATKPLPFGFRVLRTIPKD